MNWESKIEEKRRMEKLYTETRTQYGFGCFKDDKGVFRRYYPYSTNHSGNNKKYFRRVSNRIARRRLNRNEDILNRAGHKKMFDLWWKVY